MKAIALEKFGDPGVLHPADMPEPELRTTDLSGQEAWHGAAIPRTRPSLRGFGDGSAFERDDGADAQRFLACGRSGSRHISKAMAALARTMRRPAGRNVQPASADRWRTFLTVTQIAEIRK
jgi:hypothetical protein